MKIENTAAARPQSGLAAADLVVEELVEGGITRFAAMFQSRLPHHVGPVRSVRNVDASLAGPTRGLLAYSGGAGHVLRIVGRAPLKQLAPGQAGNAYYRSSHRSAPHNLYAKTRTLYSHARNRHTKPAAVPALRCRRRQCLDRENGKRARVLRLRFSNAEQPTWTYDRAGTAGCAARATARPAPPPEPASPRATSSWCASAPRTPATATRPATSCPRPCSRAPAPRLLATGGRVVHATWHKSGRDRRLRFTGPGGRPLTVAPGRTWLELVPRSGSVSVR